MQLRCVLVEFVCVQLSWDASFQGQLFKLLGFRKLEYMV